MQQASLAGRGLKPTHGIIGTQEWWAAIEGRTLPPYTARGVIRGLWLGQHNMGPAEFAMESDDGRVFRSLCHIEPGDAARKYTLGRRCEVDFVLQHSYVTIPGLQEPSEVVLEIRLGDTVDRLVTPIGPCHYTMSK
jgi:hypothetical protein